MIIGGGRRTGKTVALIREAERTGYPIVCPSEDMARAAQGTYERIRDPRAVHPVRIISVNTLFKLKGEFPMGSPILVDEAERVLQRVLGFEPVNMSTTMPFDGQPSGDQRQTISELLSEMQLLKDKRRELQELLSVTENTVLIGVKDFREGLATQLSEVSAQINRMSVTQYVPYPEEGLT